MADINTDIGTLAGKYILLNDIPLDDSKLGVDATYGWIPIGGYPNSFTGLFNGNGNQITNLWINRTAADNIGLFGYIQNAQIKNLTVETAEGKEVKGDNYVGGIAGQITSSSVTNSYSTSNVNGTNYVGGIAGLVDSSSSVTNSYAVGNVSGDSMVGGIAGSVVSSSSVTNSYSTSNVNGTNYVGGIAGFIYDSSITNNAAINPSVTGTNNVNRVAGYKSGTVTNNFALESMTDGTKTLNESGFTNGAYGNTGTSKSEGQLKILSTYGDDISGDGYGGLGWLFGNDDNNPWKIDEGNGYPYLYRE